jgi:uracil-DNA glycosylase
MIENCSNHLKRSLDILQPTFIVAQGKSAEIALKNAGYSSKARSLIEEINTEYGTTMVLKLSHPAARGDNNWGNSEKTPYLIQTIKPTISKALRRLYSD